MLEDGIEEEEYEKQAWEKYRNCNCYQATSVYRDNLNEKKEKEKNRVLSILTLVLKYGPIKSRKKR